MTRPRRATALGGALTGLLLVALLGPPGRAQAEERPAPQVVAPEGSSYHNGATLPLDAGPVTRRLVSRFDEALALADAEEVAAVVRELRALSDDDPATLVRFGRRTHVPALDLALRRVAASDQPGLVARVEADAAEALERARRDHDIPELMELAAGAPMLASGRGAALAAARLLFERGEWWSAASLAARAEGLPGAEALEAAARRRLAADLEGTGADPATSLDPDATLTWSFGFGRWLDGLPGRGLPAVLAGRLDVGSGDELLVLHGLGLLGVDRELLPPPEGGRPPAEASRRALLPGGRLGWLAESLSDQPWPHPALAVNQTRVAWPQPRALSAQRRGGRLFVPLNLVRRDPPQADHYPREAWLLALDLDAPDRPAWLVKAPELAGIEAGADQSNAFGPPLLVGNRVFCQLFRTGLSTTVSLVAFDADDGTLLFETPLARGDQVDRYASRRAFTDWWDLDKRAREGPPVERDGVVHVCTGFGVVAAVDGLSGRIRHTFHYDRLFSLDPESYHRAYLVDTGGWDDEPVRLWGDRVIVAPGDSRYLYVLADEPGPAGQLILDTPIERLWRRHLVGLLPDPEGGASPAMLFSELRGGRFRLELLGPDGRLLESGPPLPLGERVDLSGQPTRPLLVGGAQGRVFVPTSAGVRAYSVADLAAEPGLLDRPAGMPPVMSVQVLPHGLAALSVHPAREQMFVECWTAQP